MINFGKKLERLIGLEGNIAQSLVAKKAGLTDAAISKIINEPSRDPQWSTCCKIMQAFPHVPLRFWFSEEPDLKTQTASVLSQQLLQLSDDAWVLDTEVRQLLTSSLH